MTTLQSRTVKGIALSVGWLYVLIGYSTALMMASAIPAMNWMGVTYFAITWPLWTLVSPVHLPIFAWCFTFS